MFNTKMILVLALMVAISQPAWAGNTKISVGLLGGLDTLNEDFGTHFGWGASAHARLESNIGLGITVLSSGLGNTSSSISSNGGSNSYSGSLSYSSISGDIDFHFAGDLGGLWFGARLGSATLSTSASNVNIGGVNGPGSISESGFSWGPALGYDFMVVENLSAGLDLSYLSSSINNTNISIFNAFAAVKLYF
jgi:opacity protein-like surface antigen